MTAALHLPRSPAPPADPAYSAGIPGVGDGHLDPDRPGGRRSGR